MSGLGIIYAVQCRQTDTRTHSVPNRGMASETRGSVSVTMLWNTVSDRRIVTSENREEKVASVTSEIDG
jgi:hypothetical protein